MRTRPIAYSFTAAGALVAASVTATLIVVGTGDEPASPPPAVIETGAPAQSVTLDSYQCDGGIFAEPGTPAARACWVTPNVAYICSGESTVILRSVGTPVCRNEVAAARS